MRICMILEGCYPYVRGGLSSWMHDYIRAMPQHEFILWLIGAEAKSKGKYKYELPSNVKEVHEVFLDDALKVPVVKKQHIHFSAEEIEAHRQLIACKSPDWHVLFHTYNVRKINVNSFLMSEEFLQILLELCTSDYPYISFSELFHTIRSMLLPMLYLMTQKIPEADMYHSTATGYGGLLGAMAGQLEKKPFIITEHGIYSREREEELLRANWVAPHFKKLWISLFYMLARAGYTYAIRVTALFKRANEIQAELGCDKTKLKVINNGIHIENYENIPKKVPDGMIDIGAIVRFHPIKDIKTMIYSFFELKSKISNVRLHIMGDTDDEEYHEECLNLIEELEIKDIVITGSVNVIEYMERLDFTLLTSISEGQPLAVLESLAAGRPCVATDVGCCRELLEGTGIDHFGSAGLCSPPMHVQSISSAMEFMCSRKKTREEMGENGRKRVLLHYSHKDMVRKYLDNYGEVNRLWLASGSN